MKTLSFFLFLGIAATAYGQQRMTGSNEISLDQAIHIALDSNYTERAASLNLTSAQYTSTKASDNLLPTAAATASYGYQHYISNRYEPSLSFDTSLGLSRVLVNPNGHTVSYGINANLNIFNGGYDVSNIRAAGYNLDAAKYNLKWVRQQVAFSVVSAYVTALRTKELVATNEKTLAEYTLQLDRIKGLYSAGSVPIIQVYQQQAVVSQQDVLVIQARNNFLNAKADLLFLLNIAPDSYSNYEVSLNGIDTTLSGLKSKESAFQPTPSLINSLLDQREDFLALRSSILSSDAAIGLIRAALLPRLSGSFGLDGFGSNTQLSGIQLQHYLSGGLNLTIPLYDAAQNRMQIDIQEVQIETSKVQLEQAEEQFRSDAAKAQNNVLASEEAVAATVTELQSAEESLRAAEERLRVGAGIQVDVIIAEAQVQTARTDRVNAVYNYLLADKQLEYLLRKTNY
jgi:outer membrane protein